MLIGYARVSTDDQHLDNQRIALRAAGCQRIYEEKISGAKRDRPELIRLLDHVRDGDVLVATRLDRLARATRDCWSWRKFSTVPVSACDHLGSHGLNDIALWKNGLDRFCRHRRIRTIAYY